MRLVAAAILAAVACPGSALAQASFEAALRAEVASLRAERVALERALEEAVAADRAAEEALQREIERLTASLAELRADNTARSERMPPGDRTVSLENDARRAEQLTARARTWLSTRGGDVPEDAGIDDIVRRALERVAHAGQLRIEEGEYFGPDGRARVGPILRFASVAAVTVGPRPLPLVPAEDGSLRVAVEHEPEPPVSTPEGRSLDAILYDPTRASDVVGRAREGLFAWMDRGGPIMWPLMFFGVVAGLVAAERALALLLGGWRVRRFEQSPDLRAAWQRLRAPEADRSKEAEGALLRARADGLLEPIALVVSGGRSLEALEQQATDALQRARGRLRRGLFVLAVVASVAPLVGLLGTVTGMIGTFSVITEHGTGDPRLLSAGISEALLTTQLGLTVAVPALLAHAILLRVAHRITARIEASAVEALTTRRAEGV